MRWYKARQTGFSVSLVDQPWGAAFDGEALWVSSPSTGYITKVNTTYGKVLATYSVCTRNGGPGAAYGLLYDGSSLWVACQSNLAKVDPVTGGTLCTVAGVSAPGLAFDGANIWIAKPETFGARGVYRVAASDCTILGDYPVNFTSSSWGFAFDGDNVWVTTLGNVVFKIRQSDGQVVGTYSVAERPEGIAFDGTAGWVAANQSGRVVRLRASDGVQLGSYTVPAGPVDLAYDGENMWVVGAGTASVTKLRASDGVSLGTFAVGVNPNAIAFDGAFMWVVNAGNRSLSKL